MEKLCECLRKLDFTDHEALVYATLLKESPLSGNAIANLTKIQKGQIYSVLESLIKKGCVVSGRHSSIQYAAISYNEFIPRYQKSRIENRLKAQKECELVKNNLENEDVINSLYKNKDIFNHLNKLINSSQKHIMMKLWSNDVSRVEESLLNAYQRGVTLEIIIFGDYHNSLIPCTSIKKMVWEDSGFFYRNIKSSFDDMTICCCRVVEDKPNYATWTTNSTLFRLIHASLQYDVRLGKMYDGLSESKKDEWADLMVSRRGKY